MTTQEAIQGLKNLFSKHELTLPCTDSLEILHMAIDALGKQAGIERALERLEEMKLVRVEQCHEDYEMEVITKRNFDDAIEIIKQEVKLCD